MCMMCINASYLVHIHFGYERQMTMTWSDWKGLDENLLWGIFVSTVQRSCSDMGTKLMEEPCIGSKKTYIMKHNTVKCRIVKMIEHLNVVI